ncbi:hemerythrin domain-containing protein [soil metagenome]|jgi:esterase/lipase superfamily enzyme
MADIIDLIYADHDWVRRQFFYLDAATDTEDLRAIWEPLADRLDTHADAEETVFYPALLKVGRAGDPEDETEDAIDDHNSIRDAIAAARKQEVGTDEWFEAVGQARTENGKHLDEEERGALADFIKSGNLQLRHETALQWLDFYAHHRAGRGVDTSNKDADAYIEEHK